MAEPEQNQSGQNQQAGGESQGGSQPQTPQTPPTETKTEQPQSPSLPKELSDLGFKDVGQVIGYLAQAGDDARKSKAMFKTLAEQVQGKQQQEPELTDDDFIQSPKAATEKAARKLVTQYEERVSPLMLQVIEGNVSLQKMQLRQDPVFGGLVDELEKDLDEYLATIPPELKSRPNAVKTAMEYVVGHNFPRVSKKFNEMAARAGAASEGGSNAPGGGTKSSSPQLGEDERVSAQKQINAGVFKDMADYMKWREE